MNKYGPHSATTFQFKQTNKHSFFSFTLFFFVYFFSGCFVAHFCLALAIFIWLLTALLDWLLREAFLWRFH